MRQTRNADGLFVALALLAGAVLAYLVATQPLIAVGTVAGCGVLAITIARPLLGLTIWVAVVFFVPEWTTVQLGPISVRAYQLVGVATLAGIILSPRARLRHGLGIVDAVFAAGVGLVGLFALSGTTPLFTLINVVAAMALPYIIGRLAPDGIQTRMCIMAAVLAVWGVLEVVTNVHVFANWMPSLSHHWGDIQTRAGLTRAEASMGHAISFGAVCALCLPYVSRLDRHQRTIGALLVVGVVASLSRGPLLALIATAGLGVAFLIRRGRRTTAALGLLVVSSLVGLAFNFVYSGSDASDVQLSGEQRLVQFRGIIDSVRWFEPVPFQLSSNGALIAGSVDTIDSTPLRFAVNYGWLGAILLLAPVAYAAFKIVTSGKATPSSLAVTGQVPVLLVTTLITQWQVLFLFAVGLAVTELRGRQVTSALTPAGTTARAFSTDEPRTKWSASAAT